MTGMTGHGPEAGPHRLPDTARRRGRTGSPIRPGGGAAPLRVPVRAPAYLVVEVQYVVRARYQILMALSRPIPVTVEPS